MVAWVGQRRTGCARKKEKEGLPFATCFRAQNIDKTVRHLTMDACLWCSVLVPGIEPHFCDRFLGRRRRLGGKLVVSKSGCTRSGWGAGSPSPAAVREDVVNTSRVASVVLCLLDARSSALVAGDNGAALLLAADGWTSAAASSLRTFAVSLVATRGKDGLGSKENDRPHSTPLHQG